MFLKSWRGRACLIAVATLALIYLTREKVLFALGEMLVRNEQPFHADAVLVLGGDYSGNRMLKGAQLVKDGWAPIVIMSGAGPQYGFYESQLAVEYAVKKGYDRNTMVSFTYAAVSTADEAVFDIQELRKRKIRSYILVTSPSHSARATRTFQKVAPDLAVRSVISPEPHWNNGRWWTNREGRKIWFFATVKTLAEYLDL